jgi:Fic family protein
MDLEALRRSPRGQLVPITLPPRHALGEPVEYEAFLPLPLPDQLQLSNQTWKVASDAANAIGALRQACAHLPNPRLLIEPALVKEAQATSALEGTYGALGEIMQAQLPGFQPSTPEVREINAYIEMARSAFVWIRERPVTVGLLCDMQKILAEGSRRPVRDPGRIRTSQVYIGPEDCEIAESRFVPPPPGDRLRADVDDCLTWVGARQDLPIEVRIAMAHYQFETLHPFSDCNGRVGRLVVLLQLLLEGRLDEPALTLSPWLLKRRAQYQDQLLALSCTGDWNPWIQFFCEGLIEQCDRHVEVARQIISWLEGLRTELNDRHWTGTIGSLAADLIAWPVVTNSTVQTRYGCTAPTAQKAIDRLVELEVLTELTGGNYARVWGARPVMELVESL